MQPVLAYSQILSPPENALTEITRKGPFSDWLPSIQGRVFAESDEKILVRAGVPEPKAWRYVSRAGCLLLLHYRPLLEAVKKSGIAPDRIGIYVTSSAAPVDWAAIAEIAKAPTADFTASLRKQLPRKQIFKGSPYSGITELGILLGLTGPQLTFLDEGDEVPAVLDHALFDLETGAVELAIIAAVNALDDPLAIVDTASREPASRFSEASVALVAGRHSAGRLREAVARNPVGGRGAVAYLSVLGGRLKDG